MAALAAAQGTGGNCSGLGTALALVGTGVHSQLALKQKRVRLWHPQLIPKLIDSADPVQDYFVEGLKIAFHLLRQSAGGPHLQVGGMSNGCNGRVIVDIAFYSNGKM